MREYCHQSILTACAESDAVEIAVLEGEVDKAYGVNTEMKNEALVTKKAKHAKIKKRASFIFM